VPVSGDDCLGVKAVIPTDALGAVAKDDQQEYDAVAARNRSRVKRSDQTPGWSRPLASGDVSTSRPNLDGVPNEGSTPRGAATYCLQ
jgi:hypothetical protein